MSIGSFSGDLANPITDARLEKSLSGPALAKKLGLSRQYLNRAEQGTYTSLNPALLKWTSQALSIEVRSVELRYVKFQKTTRRATTERIGPHQLVRPPGNTEPGHVLFGRWRNGYWTSPTQFSIAFCVHSDAVQKYEEGVQLKMPATIKEALFENGLIEKDWADDLEALRARQRAVR